VCNFVPVKRNDYKIGVPHYGRYAEIFTTDKKEYGGNGVCNGDSIGTLNQPLHGFEQCVSLTLPENSVIFLRCTKQLSKKKTTVKIKQTNVRQMPETSDKGVMIKK